MWNVRGEVGYAHEVIGRDAPPAVMTAAVSNISRAVNIQQEGQF